jgi:hypothetical protein
MGSALSSQSKLAVGKEQKVMHVVELLGRAHGGRWVVKVEIDDEIVARLEALGMSVEELVREYLVGLADSDEFERLSKMADGDSRGWKFNREEIHERR